MDLKQHVIELSNTPGLAGYEAPVRDLLRGAWRDLADDLAVDALGNLIATRNGSGLEPRRRVLVTAHMDEIGLMVTRLEGSFLRVTNVGGIDRRVLLGQPVVIHGLQRVPGVVASLPPHLLTAESRKHYPQMDEFLVDTGLPPARVRKLIPVGAPVSFDQQAIELGKDLICGKAMDNRASIAMLTDLLGALQTRTHQWDVIVAAAVQEEVGYKGAATLAWRTQPDIALVVDTTWAIGTGVTGDHGFKLGGGPTLTIGPNAHPKLFHLIKETAERQEIELHSEPLPKSSGTDAWPIQISRDGVATAIFSIPIRNMHSPVEIVSVKDIQRVTRLIAQFVSELDEGTIEKLSLDGDEQVLP